MEENSHPPEAAAARVMHEQSDINAWAVTRFGIALSLMLIVSLLILFALFSYFRSRDAGHQVAVSQGVGTDARSLPPEPRLQASPRLDMREMRQAEEQVLDGYSWVDADHGIVRIPVSRAMEILVQKGFPVRSEPGTQTADGVSIPTESSLGVTRPMLPPRAEPAPAEKK